MKLTQPVIITPRLLPGVRVGEDSFVSIEYFRSEGNGRMRYRYYIDLPETSVEGMVLVSGLQGGSLQGGLESLLWFLANAGERYASAMRGNRRATEDGPFAAISEWCYLHSDELRMLEADLSENEDRIVE